MNTMRLIVSDVSNPQLAVIFYCSFRVAGCQSSGQTAISYCSILIVLTLVLGTVRSVKHQTAVSYCSVLIIRVSLLGAVS